MLLAIIPLVVAILWTTQTPASAHSFGLMRSDNSDFTHSSDEDWDHDWSWWNHFVHFESMQEFDWRTDLREREEARFRGNGDTDVRWFVTGTQAGHLPPGTNADYVCTNVRNGRCNQGRVRFNQEFTNRAPVNTGWYLVCHEFGHHFGFEHMANTDPEAGCMTQFLDPWNPPATGGSLNRHMIDHINGAY